MLGNDQGGIFKKSLKLPPWLVISPNSFLHIPGKSRDSPATIISIKNDDSTDGLLTTTCSNRVTNIMKYLR